MKTVLLTGASGFIGRMLCNQLHNHNYTLIGLTRNPERHQRLWPHVQWIGTLHNIPKTTRIDIVVNLAGAPLSEHRWSADVKHEIYTSRINMTQQLYDFFEQHLIKPSIVISGSAIGYYGPNQDNELTELSSPTDSFSHQLCAQWEYEAEKFQQFGSRVCLLRLGIVLDRNGGALQAMLPAFSFGLGGPMGDGKQWMSWIHRYDVIRLILFCLTNDIAGPINAVSPMPVKNNIFAATLAKALGRPCLLRMPGWVLKLLFGEMAEELLLSGQRVVPDLALAKGFTFNYPKLDSAFEEIFNKDA